MAKRNKLFICHGTDTLEETMMKAAVLKTGHDLINITAWLANTDMSANYDKTKAFVAEACTPDVAAYLFPSAIPQFQSINEKLEIPAGRLFALRDDQTRSGTSALAKLYAVLGYHPSRYENLVSGFAFDYLPGIKRAGATEEETKQICLRDRLIRGSDLNIEEIATQRVYMIAEMTDPARRGDIYQISTTQSDSLIWDKRVQRALLDHALLQWPWSRDGVSVLFKEVDDNDKVISMTAYTNRVRHAYDAKKLAEQQQYRVERFEFDLRTKFQVLRITSDGNPDHTTQPTADFNACFNWAEHDELLAMAMEDAEVTTGPQPTPVSALLDR